MRKPLVFANTAEVRRTLAMEFPGAWFYFGVDNQGIQYCQFRPIKKKYWKLFNAFALQIRLSRKAPSIKKK